MMYRSLIIFCCLTLFTGAVFAKKLYKYQDKQGKWHYSDQQPDTQQDIEIKQLKVTAKRRVRLIEDVNEKKPEYSIRNEYFGPVEVELVFTRQDNVRSKPELPNRFVVQSGKSKPLLQIGAVNQAHSWSYSLNYRYMIGDPEARHNDAFRYLPPFDPADRFQITQAFGGEFSHQDDENKYAVDIAMPVGTPLYAARAGIVMAVDNDFYRGGTDNQVFRSRANSIRILHDDGSMALYAHLQLEQAQVNPGMSVKAGQLLAYSGNTGYSSGPHLHFVIQVNKGMALVSVPFNFLTHDGATQPQFGMWLSGS